MRARRSHDNQDSFTNRSDRPHGKFGGASPTGVFVQAFGAEELAETFAICSFWLVGNLGLAGETERAYELFDRLIGYANDVGLLSEQIDSCTGELLGNFPQAFSHVGLIGAAMNLQRSEGDGDGKG